MRNVSPHHQHHPGVPQMQPHPFFCSRRPRRRSRRYRYSSGRRSFAAAPCIPCSAPGLRLVSLAQLARALLPEVWDTGHALIRSAHAHGLDCNTPNGAAGAASFFGRDPSAYLLAPCGLTSVLCTYEDASCGTSSPLHRLPTKRADVQEAAASKTSCVPPHLPQKGCWRPCKAAPIQFPSFTLLLYPVTAIRYPAKKVDDRASKDGMFRCCPLLLPQGVSRAVLPPQMRNPALPSAPSIRAYSLRCSMVSRPLSM